MRNSEGRMVYLMTATVVVLVVLMLATGCSTVQGVCKDVGAATRAIAEAAARKDGE